MPARAEELDIAWAQRVLGTSVAALEVEPLEGARGAFCDLARLRLDWEGPPTLVAKVARRTDDYVWIDLRPYQRETDFYRGDRPPAVRIPTCWYGAVDEIERRACLVLDDLGDGATVSETAGLSPDQASAALVEVAGLHAAHWERAGGVAFLRRWDAAFLQLLENSLAASMGSFIEAVGIDDSDVRRVAYRVLEAGVAATADSWKPPHTFVHGDFRADNLVYDGSDCPIVLDWQLCSLQGPARDVASVLIGSVTTEVRQASESELIREYRRALRAGGVEVTETSLREKVATRAIADLAGYAITIPLLEEDAETLSTVRVVCERRVRFLADHF